MCERCFHKIQRHLGQSSSLLEYVSEDINARALNESSVSYVATVVWQYEEYTNRFCLIERYLTPPEHHNEKWFSSSSI